MILLNIPIKVFKNKKYLLKVYSPLLILCQLDIESLHKIFRQNEELPN